MNKRTYPLHIIDRSKNSSFPFDFVTCLHKTCGFVARVVHFKDGEKYKAFRETLKQIENHSLICVYQDLKQGGVVLQIEDYLFSFDETNTKQVSKVKSLLNRALKYYLHGEVKRTPKGEFGVDKQIQQQELTIERAKNNYDALVAETSKEQADYTIELAEATLETLKKFRDNIRYFDVNLN